ncbi:ABC transporter substrate-binding protein [Halorussus litoreus]|uniref:ABC transporter substrate-binding protein n=1 Tax=Halorussus litoreus TaxID=1710536 RepID=UPI000E24125A|nr:ABC transporter substrate-binding protein [Halorussus litoreus]
MADENVSRRRWLAALGATGAAGLAGCMGGGESEQDTTTTAGDTTTTAAETTDEGMTETTAQTTAQTDVSGTVKIGVLQPVSGDLQYYGQQGLWGFYSGLAHKAGTDPIADSNTGTQTISVGDVDYELVVRDSQFSADTAQQLATDLVQNDGVDMLYGCASSGAADRVIQTVAKQAQVPYMVGPAASATTTGSSETCGEMIFRASENTAMDARSGGRYVARETDVSKVYLFGADYSFGQAVVNNYREVLESEGVEIVGERFVPQGYAEWEGLLQNAQDAGAEGIVGGFTVATLPNLFTSFLNGDYDYRMFGGFATQITNAAVGQTLVNALGEDFTREDIADAKMGPFTTRYHWNQYDNEINNEFVETYTSTYGVVPDLFTSGCFTAASAIAQAVTESGSTEGADIANALRGMTVTETPKGEGGYTFQEYDNQARSAMTVADVVPTSDEWADSWDAAVMPSEPLATISKDNTTVPADGVDCSL